MRLRILIFALWVTVTGLVFQPACTTNDESDDTQFILTVIPGEGVTGEPAAGTFTYDQGEVVSYIFTLMEGYGTLNVTLDGAEVPSSGTVTMNTDHVLSAQAGGCQIDVRGKWKGVMVWPFNNPYNIYDLYFDMECFGDLLSGRLEGNLDIFPLRERGTYAVEGCNVRLDIEFQWMVVSAADNDRSQSARANGVLPTGKLIIRGMAENHNRLTGTWEIKNVYFNNSNGLVSYSGSVLRIARLNYSGTFWLERE